MVGALASVLAMAASSVASPDVFNMGGTRDAQREYGQAKRASRSSRWVIRAMPRTHGEGDGTGYGSVGYTTG